MPASDSAISIDADPDPNPHPDPDYALKLGKIIIDKF
jgi:hypothetical protein